MNALIMSFEWFENNTVKLYLTEALSDAEKAIELNPSSAKANLRKG